MKKTKYECKYDNCDYFAYFLSSLKAHINSVHKQIRNFPCEFPTCSMRFYNNRDKFKHMSKKHDIVEDNPKSLKIMQKENKLELQNVEIKTCDLRVDPYGKSLKIKDVSVLLFHMENEATS